MAAEELGFEPTACYVVWSAIENNKLEEAAHTAALQNDAELLNALLVAGAEVDPQPPLIKGGPFLHAIDKGYFDIVRVFLENGADAGSHQGEQMPLKHALFTGNQEIARLLIEYGADMEAVEQPALTIIAKHRPEMVEFVQGMLDR